jgi:hypothetical protein
MAAVEARELGFPAGSSADFRFDSQQNTPFAWRPEVD